ncbi:MAG: ATP-binding cassette domain-containing protein [Pseudomonadota bacterium]
MNAPVAAEQARPVVQFEAVSKVFGGQTAVHAVSLSIREGEFVAIVGGSGSGKTTLLKMVNRLLEPDSGRVVVAVQPEPRTTPALRRQIGYVFQAIGLFPHLTVAENIGITPTLLGWPAAQVSQRVVELLELVELPRDTGSRLPRALSGGQQQRVGVARALAARPRIMLMDEPFGALDPLTRDALGTRYRALHDQMGLSTLMVTHDVLEAALLADRIIVMRAGKVVADGAPVSLLSSQADAGVRALMDTPRRQALKVAELLRGIPLDG